MSSNKNKVLQFFEINKEDSFRPGQVGEEVNIEKKDMKSIIDELKKEGKIYSPKRCFYQYIVPKHDHSKQHLK